MSPYCIALDGSDNLYIGDNSVNESVRKVSALAGIITTVAGNGKYGYKGDGGLATQASITGTGTLAVNAAGDIFIATGTLIRKVSAATGIITTVVGSWDAYGEKGDGGAATSAQINPFGLTFDSAGKLFFSNSPGAIREVNMSTGAISRVAGIGFSGFAGDGGPALAARMSLPSGIAFDPAGNLI